MVQSRTVHATPDVQRLLPATIPHAEHSLRRGKPPVDLAECRPYRAAFTPACDGTVPSRVVDGLGHTWCGRDRRRPDPRRRPLGCRGPTGREPSCVPSPGARRSPGHEPGDPGLGLGPVLGPLRLTAEACCALRSLFLPGAGSGGCRWCCRRTGPHMVRPRSMPTSESAGAGCRCRGRFRRRTRRSTGPPVFDHGHRGGGGRQRPATSGPDVSDLPLVVAEHVRAGDRRPGWPAGHAGPLLPPRNLLFFTSQAGTPKLRNIPGKSRVSLDRRVRTAGRSSQLAGRPVVRDGRGAAARLRGLR